jgi:outer membrane protein TolC
MVLISTLIFIRANADELSLSSSMQEAQTNNPDIRRLKYKLDAAGWEKWHALSGHLPHLAVVGNYFFDAKYSTLDVDFLNQLITFPNAFPQSSVTLQASINIFDGLETINNYRAARSEYSATQLEYDYGVFRLNEMITIKYYQALAAQELARVAEQNIKTLDQHLGLAKANLRAGVSTNYDVLRIESQLEEARAEKILDDDNVVIAKRALFEALGRDSTQESADTVVLDGSMPTPDQNKLPANLSLDLSKRGDIIAETEHENAARQKHYASYGFWAPRIDFFASADYYKFGSFYPSIVLNSDGYNSDWSYGLKFTWNLFDGGASIARSAEAADSYYSEQENNRHKILASKNEFDTWKRRYTYNSVLYHARLRTIDKSQESVRLATIGVKAGTKTHSEVLDAELELFRARAGAIHAQVDAAEAMSNLSLSVGRKIE